MTCGRRRARKAKEWAAKLAEAPDNPDETLKAFVQEIGTVAKQRGGSASAVEGAVREQRAKLTGTTPTAADRAQLGRHEVWAGARLFKKCGKSVEVGGIED
jgi:hypothetical protein